MAWPSLLDLDSIQEDNNFMKGPEKSTTRVHSDMGSNVLFNRN